jgi:hypothetical protein
VTLIVGTHLEILDHASPRLGRLGWRVLDVPGPLVDADTLEVVVTEPPDFLDPRGLAEIDNRYPPGPSERPVRPGRYEIRNLLAVGTFGSDDRPRDPASAREVMHALMAPPGDAEARGDVAHTVAGLVDRVEPRWLDGGDHRELLGVLEELAGDGRSAVTERGGKHE